MIVVDASAVVESIVLEGHIPGLSERLTNDGDLHAPHLVDVEVTHALRRLVASGQLTSDRASDARMDAADLLLMRYPHLVLLERAWELRENMTVYDGVYIALAELLRAPLVTCDARLAQTPGHHAEVEVFEPDYC